MARTRLAFVLLCFFFTFSLQYGILRVEEIFSNLDTETIVIEDITIDHSTMYVDYIEDLSSEGVFVEEVLFSDGSITLPRYFTHCCGINFLSALYANGGIFADAGLDSGKISFKVEDNTGNTDILGEVHAQGGIVVNDGFFVEKFTGDTTIFARILPNGGITVNENLFTVSPVDGRIVTKENAQFLDDVYFGVSATSSRFVSRIDTAANQGGGTYFKGQDALQIGGDIHLCPGNGTERGNIWVGDSNSTPLFFGRSSVSDGTNGGFTVFAGQSSLNGEGGDLFFFAGDSFGFGPGGDIVLAPGKSIGHGTVGKLILGAPNTGELNHDLIVGRPPLVSGDSADTFWAGQSTKRGVGGNTYFKAGSVQTGVGIPGDVIISPGDSVNTNQGFVQLGRPIAASLEVKRFPVSTAAGLTLFTSQSGYNGRGGDLILEAGWAGDLDDLDRLGFVGGDLFLETGSSTTGEPGRIVLGLPNASLNFRRVPTLATGRFTEITGQDSSRGTGGDLNLWAGNGHTDGGDLWLATGNGGDLYIEGGLGGTDGGDVVVKAGGSNRSTGGDILLISGATESTNFVGGDISIEAGVGLNNGTIIFGPTINQVYVNQVPIIVTDGDLLIYGGDNLLSFHTDDPESIVRWNGETILRNKLPVYRIDRVGANLSNLRQRISDVHYYLEALLISVSQCGHNLLHTRDRLTGDLIDECESLSFAVPSVVFNDLCVDAYELVFNFEVNTFGGFLVEGTSVGTGTLYEDLQCDYPYIGTYEVWYTTVFPASGVVGLNFAAGFGGFVSEESAVRFEQNCNTDTFDDDDNCLGRSNLYDAYSIDYPFAGRRSCIGAAPGTRIYIGISSNVPQDFAFYFNAVCI